MKKKGSKLDEYQKIAKQGGVCQTCNKHSNYLTIDHIIPKHILEMLDLTGEACFGDVKNFEFVCPTCNKFKDNRLDIKNPKTKILLQKYIDLL